MKKIFTIAIAALIVAAMFIPTFAATPAYPAEYSEMLKNTANFHYISVNSTSNMFDFFYGGDFSKTVTASGKQIVNTVTDEATQIYANLGEAGSTFYSAVLSINNPAQQTRQFSVNAVKDAADSIYHSAFPFSINGGADTTVSSFTIAVAPETCTLYGAPNGFDIYLGTEAWQKSVQKDDGGNAIVTNGTYKLAYHGEALNDSKAWKQADDGTYQFIEADFTETFQASYGVILFTWDGVKDGVLGTNASGTERAYLAITEFCIFEGKLADASKIVQQTTEAATTEAPKTEAPVVTTEPAKTEAPVVTTPAATDKGDTPIITAAPKTEPVVEEKKGCGGAIASLAIISVMSLGALVIKKKH